MNNRQLFRIQSKSVLGGVAAGVADYFGMDMAVMRLIFFILALFSGGSFFLAYLILWAALPKETTGYVPNVTMVGASPGPTTNGMTNGTQVAGYILLGVGCFMLFNKLFWFIHLTKFIPAIIFMGIGAFLIIRHQDNQTNQQSPASSPPLSKDH